MLERRPDDLPGDATTGTVQLMSAPDQAMWQALLALRPRLRRFACGLTGSVEEGDDLVQATYQRAMERRDQWQPGTRLDSWIFRIAHTIWISRLRHAAVRAGRGEPVDPDTLIGCDGERSLEARLQLADLRRLVAELPEEQRSAIMLVAVDGMSYAAASQVLGVPPGTRASRLARARQWLLAAMKGEPPSPERPTRLALAGSRP